MSTLEANQLESDIDQALAGCDLGRAEALALRYRVLARAEHGPDDGALSLRFRASYLGAQVALAAGSLQQAVQRLADLHPLPPSLPAALACRIWLLSAEALARLRRFDQARQHLNGARGWPERRDHPLLHLRELRIRLWLGEVADLADELTGCRHRLEEQGDPANLALLWCEEGRAWDAKGELARADECWRCADRVSRPLGVDPIRADVLLQIGRLAHLRGHLQTALDHYEEAQRCSPARPQLLELRLRRLLVLLELNQTGQACNEWARLSHEQWPEEVRGLADMVGALLGDESAIASTVELCAYQAAARGAWAEASALYRQALAETPAPARRARLALALGLLALAAADQREAGRWLGQAEELARSEHLPEVLWRALQARGQLAAELQGDDGRARRLFEEAVLVAESQARTLRHRTDAAAHHLHRAGVLRQLLRAACRRGDAVGVFRYQELDRGRLLWELWRGAAGRSRSSGLDESSELSALDRQLEECDNEWAARQGDVPETALRQREELLLQRDRLLDEFLRDRSRRSDSALPALPELADLELTLPDGTVFLAPALLDEELYLLVVRRGHASQVLRAQGSAAGLVRQIETFRQRLAVQLERYQRGFSVGRAELDECLDELGRGALGEAIDGAVRPGERLIWVPDGALHGVPVHALRREGCYLIEDHEVVYTFGGALLVHQARQRHRWRGGAVVVTETAGVLPAAAEEGRGVAATFCRGRILHGEQATRDALWCRLPSASAVHFACHAYFDVEHPLTACIRLPSGQTWRALEWLDEPLDGLPLATLSACRSAEVAPLVGREVFGLVTGLLGSGVRAVLAGLWPIADREALPFMWRFYRHRMTRDLAGALAQTQREVLSEKNSSPLFWAAFALLGDPQALPAPPWWRLWWARWRQRRHAARFPIPGNEPV